MLQVTVVTPEQEAFDAPCTEITVPGLEGEIGILDGHLSLVTALRPGVLSLNAKDGGIRIFAIGAGYAEVKEDRVIVLTDVCTASEDLDLSQAKKDLVASEEALKSANASSPEFTALTTKYDRARAQLDAHARIS